MSPPSIEVSHDAPRSSVRSRTSGNGADNTHRSSKTNKDESHQTKRSSSDESRRKKTTSTSKHRSSSNGRRKRSSSSAASDAGLVAEVVQSNGRRKRNSSSAAADVELAEVLRKAKLSKEHKERSSSKKKEKEGSSSKEKEHHHKSDKKKSKKKSKEKKSSRKRSGSKERHSKSLSPNKVKAKRRLSADMKKQIRNLEPLLVSSDDESSPEEDETVQPREREPIVVPSKENTAKNSRRFRSILDEILDEKEGRNKNQSSNNSNEDEDEEQDGGLLRASSAHSRGELHRTKYLDEASNTPPRRSSAPNNGAPLPRTDSPKWEEDVEDESGWSDTDGASSDDDDDDNVSLSSEPSLFQKFEQQKQQQQQQQQQQSAQESLPSLETSEGEPEAAVQQLLENTPPLPSVVTDKQRPAHPWLQNASTFRNNNIDLNRKDTITMGEQANAPEKIQPETNQPDVSSSPGEPQQTPTPEEATSSPEDPQQTLPKESAKVQPFTPPLDKTVSNLGRDETERTEDETSNNSWGSLDGKESETDKKSRSFQHPQPNTEDEEVQSPSAQEHIPSADETASSRAQSPCSVKALVQEFNTRDEANEAVCDSPMFITTVSSRSSSASSSSSCENTNQLSFMMQLQQHLAARHKSILQESSPPSAPLSPSKSPSPSVDSKNQDALIEDPAASANPVSSLQTPVITKEESKNADQQHEELSPDKNDETAGLPAPQDETNETSDYATDYAEADPELEPWEFGSTSISLKEVSEERRPNASSLEQEASPSTREVNELVEAVIADDATVNSGPMVPWLFGSTKNVLSEAPKPRVSLPTTTAAMLQRAESEKLSGSDRPETDFDSWLFGSGPVDVLNNGRRNNMAAASRPEWLTKSMGDIPGNMEEEDGYSSPHDSNNNNLDNEVNNVNSPIYGQGSIAVAGVPNDAARSSNKPKRNWLSLRRKKKKEPVIVPEVEGRPLSKAEKMLREERSSANRRRMARRRANAAAQVAAN